MFTPYFSVRHMHISILLYQTMPISIIHYSIIIYEVTSEFVKTDCTRIYCAITEKTPVQIGISQVQRSARWSSNPHTSPFFELIVPSLVRIVLPIARVYFLLYSRIQIHNLNSGDILLLHISHELLYKTSILTRFEPCDVFRKIIK